MITKYEFSKAALYFEPHANNVVFHQNEKHFGNTIQMNETGDTTIPLLPTLSNVLLYLQLADLDLSGGAQPTKVMPQID